MLRDEIDTVHNQLTAQLGKKADAREVDHLTENLTGKADHESISGILANLKVDFNDAVHSL
jgi:hypothetical protein